MRSKASSGTRTYLIAISSWTKPVDLRTLRRITNPLSNGCLSCIRSSDNEHSELDTQASGDILLCGHSAKGLYEERLAKVMIRRSIPLPVRLCVIITVHQLTTLAAMPARTGVNVLCMIGTRTIEEHDGYHRYLRPGIRRHDNLQKVRDMTETCERSSPREITALFVVPSDGISHMGLRRALARNN